MNAQKHSGKQAAAQARNEQLSVARKVASQLAQASPSNTTNMDAVREVLDAVGIELGPAAGSVFSTDDWRFTGVRIESTHPANHGREIKVWRYCVPPRIEFRYIRGRLIPIIGGKYAPRLRLLDSSVVREDLNDLLCHIHREAFHAGRESVRSAIQGALRG